jgi:hypothetical protein
MGPEVSPRVTVSFGIAGRLLHEDESVIGVNRESPAHKAAESMERSMLLAFSLGDYLEGACRTESELLGSSTSPRNQRLWSR